MALPGSRADREQQKFIEIDGEVAVKVASIAGNLVPEKYDKIDITYDVDDNIETVIYKLDSTVVATLTLSYTGGLLTNITKT